MLKKIKLQKNKLACFHYHTLTDDEREFIIFNLDPVKFLNYQIELFNAFATDENEFEKKFPHTAKEIEKLKSIINKLDIFDRK